MKDYIDTFKNWKNIEGKSSRNSFWMAVLLGFIIGLLLFAVSQLFSVLSFINFIYALILIIPFFTLGVRRFHDVGRSGATWAWILLPIFGWIYVLILFSKK